ncbi:metal ABC transporter solute-binding protein, Zn/Mn family [Paenibacillus aquistagni]|uniref:metal ABC transporter solute-binding protein, Zn/Mn family n=1 Tax=Paenibacillus aquistagni TaxID=1852522 RepID=UPI00145AEB99|nr:zinc ABC transporter substrate-binding protein [Paenibacillus aquistagni]NMM50947.1 zinc ABC transporter solute-binding protein [Paenibacillus aquistagni]
MKKKVVRKRMMVVGVLALALSVVLSACGAKEQEGASSKTEKDKLTVVTTIAQIAEPLSVIGGDRIHVESLMGPGIDPHTYNASQGDIQKLESGDMIFYSGLHLEANMVKVFDEISKTRTVVAISESIAPEKLLKDEEGTTDPHVWFDIDLWKEAINNATEALKKERSQDADFFEANKVKYFEELDKLKLEAQTKLSEIPKDKRVLVTAHDAFGYFGRMLDIEVVGLQGLSTEDEIGLSDIEDTIQTLVTYEVPAVFVESSVNPASINAVIEGAKKQGLDVKLGGELFSDAMGVEGTEEGTYLGMYRHNVETIYHALNVK